MSAIILKKGFGSKSVYNEKYIRSKIKYYERKINTNLYDNGIPKDGSYCICQSVLLIDY